MNAPLLEILLECSLLGDAANISDEGENVLTSNKRKVSWSVHSLVAVAAWRTIVMRFNRFG